MGNVETWRKRESDQYLRAAETWKSARQFQDGLRPGKKWPMRKVGNSSNFSNVSTFPRRCSLAKVARAPCKVS